MVACTDCTNQDKLTEVKLLFETTSVIMMPFSVCSEMIIFLNMFGISLQGLFYFTVLIFGVMLFCSIDATKEPTEGPMLGRLVNHGERKERNTKLQIVNFHGTPALCLYALRDIKEGEELLYDYGVANLPWKKKVNTSSSYDKFCKFQLLFRFSFIFEVEGKGSRQGVSLLWRFVHDRVNVGFNADIILLDCKVYNTGCYNQPKDMLQLDKY